MCTQKEVIKTLVMVQTEDRGPGGNYVEKFMTVVNKRDHYSSYSVGPSNCSLLDYCYSTPRLHFREPP